MFKTQRLTGSLLIQFRKSPVTVRAALPLHDQFSWNLVIRRAHNFLTELCKPLPNPNPRALPGAFGLPLLKGAKVQCFRPKFVWTLLGTFQTNAKRGCVVKIIVDFAVDWWLMIKQKMNFVMITAKLFCEIQKKYRVHRNVVNDEKFVERRIAKIENLSTWKQFIAIENDVVKNRNKKIIWFCDEFTENLTWLFWTIMWLRPLLRAWPEWKPDRFDISSFYYSGLRLWYEERISKGRWMIWPADGIRSASNLRRPLICNISISNHRSVCHITMWCAFSIFLDRFSRISMLDNMISSDLFIFCLVPVSIPDAHTSFQSKASSVTWLKYSPLSLFLASHRCTDFNLNFGF